jgi:hypothetical protein
VDGRVQHVLEASADDVWDHLQHGDVVYVCGNASTMAPGVRGALVAFRLKKDASEADADAWLAGCCRAEAISRTSGARPPSSDAPRSHIGSSTAGETAAHWKPDWKVW